MLRTMNFSWALTCLTLHSLLRASLVVHAADEECGKQANGASCPLNVCCSQWGFCGVTSEFCDVAQNCQSNCGSDFSAATPWGYDVRNTIIGYFEAWAPTIQGCGKKTASTIPLGSLTHINAAFGYIQPDSYTIYPIDGLSVEYFKAVTNLKARSPGTKVWLSLGGWTFSDNDTTTQPVWGDLSSTQDKRNKFILNLDKFMTQWGFDGVDLDWEYPAAPDRRGQQADTRNYLALVQDIKAYFDQKGLGWGLSFTAPASYWYMRWFDISGMANVVDFVNLMTYDMHGSWDDRSSWIGPHVYSHTNMTEIKSALQLLWRNNVPADKVNLGLAFYGRTYTLADPACSTPGCQFSGPGNPGICTGTAGYLSYAEIKNQLASAKATPIYDKETMSKYVRLDNDQWISFDDPESIKQKVDYANSIGLRGLFIWAVDQDTSDHEMLAAVLGDRGLGYFGDVGDGSDWTSYTSSGCHWADCGILCGQGEQLVTSVRCPDGDGKARKQLCCPLDGAPDPDFCTWRTGQLFSVFTCALAAENPCLEDEVLMIKDNYYTDSKGVDESCLGKGEASYCCKKEETGEKLCDWAPDTCVTLDHGKPQAGMSVCGQGQQFVTYRTGPCGSGKVQPYCCASSVDVQKLACHWTLGTGCVPGSCGQSEVSLGAQAGGGGSGGCVIPPRHGQHGCPECIDSTHVYPTLCCNKDALRVDVKTLPIPLENLFFQEDLKSLPEGSKPDFSILTDATMGGQRADTGNNDPNSNSFAWHIIDGPEEEVTNIDKRDGSHWHVYDCDTESHEGSQTAKMVCTDTTNDSNCDRIWLGQVAGTVMKMPKGCGPGKYAMAVSMEPLAEERPPPRINIRGAQRSTSNPHVYMLTFDYDFSVLQKRASKALLRIDYSDNPGYWSEIVSAPVSKTKREVQDEVDRDHEGDWHAFLDHHWNLQRRATPDHELHLLHERWFSITLDDWIQRMRNVELEYTAVRHKVDDVFTFPLYDETKVCQIGPVTQTLSAKLTASMNINVETSAQLTIMGNLGDLSSFKQSHLTLRNSGFVTVLVDVQTFAELRFGSLSNELANIAPLGASVSIPGIVTIGPQFKIIGGLSGRMAIHANAQYQLTVASWDFAQSYPYNGDKPYDQDDLNIEKDGEGAVRQGISNRTLGSEWSWDVQASGSLEVHLKPEIAFGIVWNEKLNVPNAEVDFGIDTYGRLYGQIGASSAAGNITYCYGMDAGYEVYIRATAPSLFPGLPNLNKYWPITSKEVPILEPGGNCGGS